MNCEENIMEKTKETWIMNPELAKCGIVDLYEMMADAIEGKSFDHYDCTKIEVGKEIFNRIEDYYIERGMDRASFGMMWVCYGPKASLEGYEVQVEPGWAYDD
jgi:hypothetical protein